MIELQLSDWAILRLDLATLILAFSAFGALIVSIIIGIKQTNATHATVNRQINQQWIHDFISNLSSLRSLVESIPAIVKNYSGMPISPELRERFEEISRLSDNLLLTLDIRDEKQHELQKHIQRIRKFALKSATNRITGGEWGEISSKLFDLSKRIIDQKFELLNSGGLK